VGAASTGHSIPLVSLAAMEPDDRRRLEEIHEMLSELLKVLNEYRPMLKKLNGPKAYWKRG